MPTVLHLTLKKKWFDMILSGEKKEEYREIKPYWLQRLTWHEYHKMGELDLIKALCCKETFRKDFDIVEFKNGYGKDAPTMTVEFIETSYGYPSKIEWIDSSSQTWYFCIKLGKVLSTKNIKQNGTK